ncbi:MAG TPA: ABC transporter ATP-binding protein [Thermoanaerobaculia bacterium]
MTTPAIELVNVEKAYRYFKLSDANLRLDAGQIMGLVGPNGAGKSTTIRILMGMVHQDRGDVRVLGRSMPHEQAAAKRDIGFVSEDMRLYGSATLAWHMRFVAAAYPDWDAKYADLLLRRFNLHRDQTVKVLSHGERVKATLLLALAHRPRLLLLDEPTTGLDPVARHEVLAELMDALRDEHRAILFSSHNTHDVEQISDVITFLDRGRVIDSSDKETFLDRWRRVHIDLPSTLEVPTLPGAVDTRVSGRLAVITTSAYSPELHAACERAGVTIRDVQRMTLEEIFVANVMSNREEAQS